MGGPASMLNSTEQLCQATAGIPVMPSSQSIANPKVEASSALLEEPADINELEDRRLEELRLARLGDELLNQLEQLGSLSLAEESRLNDIQHQRFVLKAL